MKTIKIITLATMLFIASNSMNAQVSINVNIGQQPSWAQEVQSSADYYYIPDVQCYYDVRATQFIYLNNGTWIRSNRLPNQYRNYDLNRGYKVVLNNYHGSSPYSNYKYDRVKYYKGYRGTPQRVTGRRVYDNNHHYVNNNYRHDNHKYYANNNRRDEHRKSNRHENKHDNKGRGNKHHH